MWKCPTCGEQIEDQFESCWKCTKVEPVATSADGHRPERRRAGFWCAWRRGWFVLLMMIVYGVVAGIWQLFFAHSEGLLAVVGIGAAFFLLPACAYWIFVLFFGEQTWPSLGGTRKGSRKD